MHGLAVAVLFGVALTWARWTQSRRVYRALWVVAAGTLFVVGLVL